MNVSQLNVRSEKFDDDDDDDDKGSLFTHFYQCPTTAYN
jgi:hypothetical protein